jgi:hypothetical protein
MYPFERNRYKPMTKRWRGATKGLHLATASEHPGIRIIRDDMVLLTHNPPRPQLDAPVLPFAHRRQAFAIDAPGTAGPWAIDQDLAN